ncbi:DUF3566 domain-containing protein [Frondihabitans australicus]|uniref:Transmembrane protein DUF3566 n=1 Tax=Frondihabitans australicus TaxID=386892 RepID=A0A495IEC4_9MICO|nr:DUF3566 domain-containing protein [Frondihabitans australicus]RKR73356.1 transmembrane protein DUF3566 [Frondihabitans australicus]
MAEVRLLVHHLGVGALAKYGLLAGVVVGILMTIAGYVAWTAFSSSGGFASLAQTLLGDGQSSSVASLQRAITTGSVMSVVVVLAAVQVVTTVVVAVLGGLAYNAAVRFTGGVMLGFSSARAFRPGR